jgi:hypothetical protein
MSRHQGRRNPGRLSARRIRRRPAGGSVKVYHQRVRDGERVVWREDCDRLRLRLMVPAHRVVPPELVAVEVLADAIGRGRAWPLAADFAAWLGAMGASWDLAEGAIWMWVASRDG